MLEPLLGEKDVTPGATRLSSENHRATRCRSAEVVVAGILRWWRITTESSFLQSRISRRASWKVIIPGLATTFLVIDSFGALVGKVDISYALSDLVTTAGCFAYACSSISSDNLLLDAALGLFAGYMNASYFLQTHVGSEHSEAAEAIFPLSFPVTMVFFSCAGVHSFAILWLLALCGACCVASAVPWESLMCSSLIGIAVIGVEYIIATLYHEWRALLGCNQRLLEAATDGFGIVDCSRGVILQASPKMAETLGKSSVDLLVGCELKDLVDARDHELLASRFFAGDAQQEGGAEPEEVMVTCCSELLQIDVRLVPYQLLGTHEIAFCVQKMGEARLRAYPKQVRYREPARGDVQEEVSGEEGEAPSDVDRASGWQEVVLTVADSPMPYDRTADDSMKAVTVARGLGTLSLSNWTVSCEGDEAEVSAAGAPGDAADSLCVTTSCAVALPTCADSAAAAAVDTGVTAAAAAAAADSETEAAPGSDFRAGRATAPGPRPAGEGAAGEGTTTSLKKAVDTRTVGVQSEPPVSTPPAPLAASSASQPAKAKALRKKRLAKVCRAVVDEGKPRFQVFAATPKSTRGNTLNQLVRSCNVRGTGCCAKHVAWMALQALITEELVSRCGDLAFCTDWQCPECRALNDFDTDDEDERQLEQACSVCGELVEPILPAPPQLQVHEKSLLLALSPLSLLHTDAHGFVSWQVLIGTWTMFPLLLRDGQVIPYISIMAIYGLVAWAHRESVGEQSQRLLPLQSLIVFSSILMALSLHGLSVVILPPPDKPDLWPTLWAIGGCGIVCIGFLAILWHLLRQDASKLQDCDTKKTR